jgi:hypothetical protein
MPPAWALSSLSRSDYEACQAQDEEGFRKAVTDITTRALSEGAREVNYQNLVASEWRRLALDDILDQRVDAVVAEVQSETSWARRVQSLADSEQAKALAVAVAERVYQSPDVKDAIEALVAGVGTEAGKHIEIASQDAAEPVVQCLKAFLGPRYGTTVAATVAGSAGEEFGLSASGEADVSAKAVIRQSSEGVTGAAILVIRRQLANMAARIGQRIVGSILARVVSVVAGGIGLVLIAKDIWELRNGVLPIIAEEMKSKETKDKVREEIAQSLATQIGSNALDIGAKSAERIVGVWREFRSAHAKVLGLAEKNEEFRTFLDAVPPATLPRLDEVTGLILETESEAAIMKRLADGTLDQAVRDLPEDAIDIARQTRSLETATRWWLLGPEHLGAVVSNEIYRRAKPDEFTKESLARLISIGDPLAIKRLSGVGRDGRDVLFERQTDELRGLARALDEEELSALAHYLSRLNGPARDRLFGAVIANPAEMQVLSSQDVRDAIIASKDQAAAVDMILGPKSGSAKYGVLVNDLERVWQGQVHPRLIWEAHPLAVIAIGIGAFMLLLLMRRILRPRRVGAVASS